MHHTSRLLTLLTMVALLMAGCTNAPEQSTGGGNDNASNGTGGEGNGTGNGGDRQPGEPVELQEGFEDGMTDWTRHSDSASGADDSAWSADVTSEGAHDGSSSLELSLGEAQGTVWLTREVSGLTAGSGYGVEMSVWVQPVNASESALHDLVLYVGIEPPADEGSFSPETAGARHMAVRAPLPTTGDWQEFSLDWGTPAPDNGTLVVAIGVSSPGGSSATYRFDDLRVAFEPK